MVFYFLQLLVKYGEIRIAEVCFWVTRGGQRPFFGPLFANSSLLDNIVTVRARQSSGVCSLRNACDVI